MTITLTWWMLPTAITVILLVGSVALTKDTGGMFGGLGAVINLAIAIFVCMIMWIVTAILK